MKSQLRMAIAWAIAWLLGAGLCGAQVNATWNSASDVPVTTPSQNYNANGVFINLTLNFAPTTATDLTVVNMTSLSFINGNFSNLTQGQAVTLNFAGNNYNFIANYYGGTGNDLVLQWANVRLMGWGQNFYGQVGTSSPGSPSIPEAVSMIGALAGKSVLSEAAGTFHSLVLCSDGSIAAWGENGDGQLGIGNFTNTTLPTQVTTSGVLAGKRVIALAAGQSHSLALCSDGTIAAWGFNNYGQLGNNSTSNSSVPVAVVNSGVLFNKPVVAISAGLFHSLALCSDGTMYTWGQNLSGQLGNGNTTESHVPVAVTTSGALSGKSVVSISAGHGHNLALCSDGTLVAWGSNGSGQVGNNSTTDALTPVAVNGFGALAGKTVTSVSGGQFHSVALCSDGAPVTWGYNASYQLGNNGTTESHVPVGVLPPGALAGKTVIKVGAAAIHNLALCSDGTLTAWGDGGYGELGNGTTASSQNPVTVSTTNFVAGERFMRISSGSSRSHDFVIVGQAPAGAGSPPVATTTTATLITSGGATLNGSVNPMGQSTSVSFDYGTTLSYGNNWLVGPPISGSGAQSVSALISGLNSGTLYHFRVKAVSSAGTIYGNDLTFTTTGGSGGGGAAVKLTNNLYDDISPKWHPTNNTIAYLRKNASGTFEPGSVNTTGFGETTLVTGLVQPQFGYTTVLSWLGNTNSLLCVETNFYHELLAFNTTQAPFNRTVQDGNDAAFTRKLFVPGGRYSNAFIASRDGTKVAWRDQPNAGGTNTLTIRAAAYSSLSGQNTNAIGTVVLTATNPSIGTRGMALSPNGSKLAISIPNGSGFDIWLYNTDGSGSPVQLTNDGASGLLNLNPDISPDGTKILYQASNGTTGSGEIWLMDIDGTNKRNVSQSSGVDEAQPSWGPDGTQYAFVRYENGESNLYKDTLTFESQVVTINFDNMTTGAKNSDFLAAYGVPSVTYFGGPGSVAAGPPTVDAQSGGNSTIPSPPNLLIQHSSQNEPNKAHTLRFEFSPRLSAFGLTRTGKFGNGSTDTWHAYFYNAAGTLLGSFGESSPLVNAAPQPFSFEAPAGETIARMDLTSIWTGFATNRNIPVDDFVLTQAESSGTTQLTSLALSSGSLSPAFASDITSYTASVANATTTINVTPATIGGGSVTVNNSPVASGFPSSPITLGPGNNTITVRLLADAGGLIRTYTVVVYRPPSTDANLSNLALNAGTLNPVFASGTTSYTANVSNATTSITVTPTVADSTATVKVNNVAVTSGSASGAINLNVGNNTITTIVKAQDNTTTKTYTVIVNRAPSSNANLANLATTSGTLSPGFASGTFGYTVNVPYAVSSLRATATAANSGATLKINNVSTASGSPSGLINLSVGSNAINVVVTAQDAVTQLTYTITVNRPPPSNNANLASLSISAGTLSPSFSAGTLAYTASLPHLTTSVSVTPATADATATMKVNNVTVASGQPSGQIHMNVGVTTIQIKVIAEDGVTSRTYVIDVTRAALVATWNAVTDVPLSTSNYTAEGNISIVLNCAPPTGTTLKVIDHGGLNFIIGRFENLAQGQPVALTFNNIVYDFVANYYGGTGNDLVLQWAATRPVAWGSGNAGKLGTDNNFITQIPTAVNQTGPLVEKTVIAVSAGSDHSIALCADGTLATWGDNSQGQLGTGNTTASNTAGAVVTSGVLNGKTVVAVAAGAFHSLALCSDGTIAAWGDNSFGQLGDNTSVMRRTSPVAVVAAGSFVGKSVVAIGAGQYHNVALCSDGTVFCWGGNFSGQIGDNTTLSRKTPTAVMTSGALNGKTVVSIAVAQYHTLALCSDGTLVSWGANYAGQLGDNTNNQRNAPIAITTNGVLSGKTVTAIAAGGYGHSLARCSDGTVAAWGSNASGQLGDNSTTQRNVPVSVNASGVLAGKSVVAIAAGENHSLALCSDGTLTSWGGNNSGELGNNGFSSSSVPVAVSTEDLTAGERFVFAASGSCSMHNLASVAAPAPLGPIPIVTTLAASSITSTTAVLNASVNANGANTTPTFQFGPTVGYGSSIAATPSPVTGSSATAVSATLTGLTPGSTYHFRVRGLNANGARNGGDVSFSTPSNNANLSGLAIDHGSLSPAFSPNTTSYDVSVPNSVAEVVFTPYLAESHATVTVDGNAVDSGNDSPPIALSVGLNSIDVVVTAQNGTTIKTYSINVTRLPVSNNATLADLQLSKGTLNPSFASASFSYNAFVSTAVTTVQVTPQTADEGATVTVFGSSVASGSPSPPINLSLGNNDIPIVVTAEDGITTQTYTVTLHCGTPSTNANLLSLTTSSGTLSPAFSSGTDSYTTHVPFPVSNITVTPTAADGTAIISGNGYSVLSGTPSVGFDLNVGDNFISIVVTAEDGIAENYFLIDVIRDPQEWIWGGANGSWSDPSKWALNEAPPVAGNNPIGGTATPMILKFPNNPVPQNPTTPTTYNAINDRGSSTGFNFGYFGVTQLSLGGGPTNASGTGESIIGSPNPGFGDPNLFFVDGGSIVNSTSNGVGFLIQNYITAQLNLNLTGNGTELVRLGGVLQANMFIFPYDFPAELHVVKTGTSTFELPSAHSASVSYEIREGALQTKPGNLTSGPITLGHATSMSATLKVGTNASNGGTLADTVDITVVAGPPGSTRTIQSLSTASNESVYIAGDLFVPAGRSLRLDTGADVDSVLSIGGNGSVLAGDGDLIVCGSGKLMINSLTDTTSFTGKIIIESGSYQPSPPIPGNGFSPPIAVIGGGGMVFDTQNGNYSQDVMVVPPLPGALPSAFNVTDTGTLTGLLTLNGGVDMLVDPNKSFIFDGGLSGAIPAGQSLNVNATGTSVIAITGDTSNFLGTIDFGRDVGIAGDAASLVFANTATFPAGIDLNVFAGSVVFDPTDDTTASGAIDFKAALPGAQPPELVVQDDTPGDPVTVTLDGSIDYERQTRVVVEDPVDRLEITGTLTNVFPGAGMEKAGEGTLVLDPLANASPPDDFDAPVLVQDGTLRVNRDLSDSDVTVQSGAVLGGSGEVDAINTLPGGIIAPGNSPGTLTAHTANLTGATLRVEIDDTDADQLLVMGPLQLGNCALVVSPIGGGFTQESYVIAQGNPLTGTFGSVPSGYSVTYTSTQAILSQSGSGTSFETWIEGFNSPPLSANDKLPGADPDHDGVSNLFEFILGGNPRTGSPGLLPRIDDPDEDYFYFIFTRSDVSESTVSLVVQVSDGLDDWTTIPSIPIPAISGGDVTVFENGLGDDEITVAIPLGTQKRFARLKAVSSSP